MSTTLDRAQRPPNGLCAPSRRSFLTGLFAAAAVPLIARPSLEDIERLTWRRRFFPGYSPPDGSIEWFTREALCEMQRHHNVDLSVMVEQMYLRPAVRHIANEMDGLIRDTKRGIALRGVKTYDIRNDAVMVRLDVLFE